MRIRYSPAARNDLRNLQTYLSAEFDSAVALKTVTKIVSDISTLKCQRGLAKPLADKIGFETPYLYFFCGKRSVAILSDEKGVYSILRILDIRMDYVRTVFSTHHF